MALQENSAVSSPLKSDILVYMHENSILNKQIALPKIDIKQALTVVVLYFISAVGLSILISNDPNWSRWHISYLGEGQKFSSHFFNASLMIGGVIMGWFTWLLNGFLRKTAILSKFRINTIIFLLLVISISVYMVGMFPLSYGNIPHDIFGHAIYFATLFLCLASPWLVPGMKRHFYIIPILMHILTLTIFIMFWTGISSNMYLAEVTTFIALVWWIYMLINPSSRSADKKL